MANASHLPATGQIAGLVTIIDCADGGGCDAAVVTIGVDTAGICPAIDAQAFDVLLTTRRAPPAPWVYAAAPRAEADRLAARIATRPNVARILVQTLRLQEKVDPMDGLTIESLAYSTLLAGGDFRKWLAVRHARNVSMPGSCPLTVARDGDILSVTLDDATTRNAISARMRDALFDILTNALDDPTAPTVTVAAAGRCFSTGGHLPEFGSSDDLALAHAIRRKRGIARLLFRLGARSTVTFHGATIGAGIEIFAAAGDRCSAPDAWFQLPEFAMGLIPGAGGTVTVSRAIGRHRACWMMVSGRRIDAHTALRWRLVHRIAA